MPRINLKPNSAEFDFSTDRKEVEKHCDMPGCGEEAEHKAPKHRGLNEYYHFCIEHVRDYNKSWNFFSGMSDSEVEDHVHKSFYGDRPTWKADNARRAEEHLKRKAWQSYSFSEKDPDFEKEKRDEQRRYTHIPAHTPEHEALAVMGLEPPVQLDEIKIRYKKLVKKHHPDLNGGCKKSEDLLKEVNMAYTILKVAYTQFDKLPDRY